MLPKTNCYGQASIRENSATRRGRKWSIWRILLTCLTSQLMHKSTICIFRDLLQLLWFRKRKKGKTLKLHPCNLWIEKKTGIADKIKNEVGTALLKVALYSRSQTCTLCKQENKWRNHAFYRLFKNYMDQKRTFTQTQQKINYISVFWAKNQHFNLRPHRLKKKEKKNLTPENKGSGPQRPSIVTTIVPENKRCMHNEVGTCMEILPLIDLGFIARS